MPLNYIIWQDLELHSKEYNILLAAGSLTKPWLIIHGNSDNIIPIAAARNLYDACDHSTKIEIDGQDHTFGCKHPMKDLSEAPHDFWFILDNTLEFITEELEDSDIQI
jgi:predicted esterase